MSLLGALKRPTSFANASTITRCASTVLDSSPRIATYPERHVSWRRSSNDNIKGAEKRRGQISMRSWEDLFVQSLVAASTCRSCAAPTKSRTKRVVGLSITTRRHFSRSASKRQWPAVAISNDEEEVHISKAEYIDLAQTYNSPSDLWLQPSWRAPLTPAQAAAHRVHMPLAPRLVFTPEQERRMRREIVPPENAEHAGQIKRLLKKLSHNPGMNKNSQIWNMYQALQTPRVRYLGDRMVRMMFRQLAWVEKRDLDGSQRYLAFLDECVAERVPLRPAEWNTAIAFASRWVKQVTSDQVRAAVETWMRMENSGVQADHVTFNILFDVAIRAGRFALADTVFNELREREMPLNRYFRTSMIYYAGLRGDGDAVRKAFRELVNAGEIVDTAVMNCVILSLVRAGEPDSAESVFAKMKQLHETKFGARGPQDWRGRKELGVLLNRQANNLREARERHRTSFFGSPFATDDQKEKVQLAAPIHPDARTCQILIKWHCLQSGNLGRVRELLQEMRHGDWNIQSGVYALIFRGFWLHGGHAHTAWSRTSLEEFWDEFLGATLTAPHPLLYRSESRELDFTPDADSSSEDLDDEDPEIAIADQPPDFTPHIASRVVSAFYKCAGKKKMLEVWAQIQDRWKEITPDDTASVQAVVTKFVREDSVYVS